jgi:4'-phosphopantetheinyl transferase
MYVHMPAAQQAFIKARGDGVAFELNRLEVRLPHASAQDWLRQPVQQATLAVDGQPQHSWRAFLQQLPNRHWVAVVRGPPIAAVDAFGVSGLTG